MVIYNIGDGGSFVYSWILAHIFYHLDILEHTTTIKALWQEWEKHFKDVATTLSGILLKSLLYYQNLVLLDVFF